MGWGDYWKLVIGTAIRDSLEAVRWDNWLRVVLALLTTLGGGIVGWMLFGDAVGIARAFAALGFTALIAFAIALVRLTFVPPKLHREAQATIVNLQSELTAPKPVEIKNVLNLLARLDIKGASLRRRDGATVIQQQSFAEELLADFEAVFGPESALRARGNYPQLSDPNIEAPTMDGYLDGLLRLLEHWREGITRESLSTDNPDLAEYVLRRLAQLRKEQGYGATA